MFRSNRPNNDSAAERGWRWSQRGRPDRVDEEDRADEVQAEEDEGELVGKQKFRMQLAKRMKEDLDVVLWLEIWNGGRILEHCVTLHLKHTND